MGGIGVKLMLYLQTITSQDSPRGNVKQKGDGKIQRRACGNTRVDLAADLGNIPACSVSETTAYNAHLSSEIAVHIRQETTGVRKSSALHHSLHPPAPGVSYLLLKVHLHSHKLGHVVSQTRHTRLTR
jgi:hypothetical protein